jgi:hypothetical protein
MRTTTAEDVIEEARDSHPAFDEYSGPDGPLFRTLRRFALALFRKAAEANPELLLEAHDVAIAFYDHEDGEELPEHVKVIAPALGRLQDGREVWVHETSGFTTHRSDLGRYFALANGRAFLQGGSRHWQDVESVRINYVREATAVEGVEDSFDLPGDPHEVLVAAACHWLAKRARAVDANARVDVDDFEDHLTNAEASYLLQLASQRKAQSFEIVEAW